MALLYVFTPFVPWASWGMTEGMTWGEGVWLGMAGDGWEHMLEPCEKVHSRTFKHFGVAQAFQAFYMAKGMTDIKARDSQEGAFSKRSSD